MADLVRYFGKATGRIQGVGFRMFVQQNAGELNVTGWIRNMEDGTVDMELQGSQAAVDEMERIIRKGNYFIKVQSFGLETRPVKADESRFVIHY